MIKVLLSSSISALAVFLLMSFGVSGQTVKPTVTVEPVATITPTAVYSDAETVLADAVEKIRELDIVERSTVSELLSLDSGTYWAGESKALNSLRSTPLDLRPLVLSIAYAYRDCGKLIELSGELSEDVFGIGILFAVSTNCQDWHRRAALALYEKHADYGIDLIATEPKK